MKQLFAALLLLVLASPVMANPMRADAAYGVRYSQEQVAQVPQDQNKPYITVIGSQSDPRFQVLQTWFQNHPTLHTLKSTTHFNAIPTESAHYTQRLASSFPVTPCVVMQDAQGNPIVEYKGAELPLTADALATGFNRQASAAECFGLFRRVQPAPQPNSPVLPAPAPRPKNHFPIVLLILLVVGAAGLGIAKEWHSLYYKKG